MDSKTQDYSHLIDSAKFLHNAEFDPNMDDALFMRLYRELRDEMQDLPMLVRSKLCVQNPNIDRRFFGM